MAPKPPEKPPEKPADKPKGQEKQPEKPLAKPPEKPPDKKQPERDTPALRQRLAEIEAEFNGYRQTEGTEKAKLLAKIVEYEKRRYLTPEQEKAYDAAVRRATDLEARLHAMDYRESQEFKDKFLAKWQKVSNQAMADVRAMVVYMKNAETGEDTTRPATVADWQRVMSAASKPEAHRIARELFRDDAQILLDHRNSLLSLEEEANSEVESRRTNYSTTRDAQNKKRQAEIEAYNKAMVDASHELIEKYPGYFKKDDAKPDEAKWLDEGDQFLQTALANAMEISPERAQRMAIIYQWARAFPLLVRRIQHLQTQLESKDGELSKVRATDPGAGGDGPPPTSKSKEPGGSKELAEMLTRIPE